MAEAPQHRHSRRPHGPLPPLRPRRAVPRRPGAAREVRALRAELRVRRSGRSGLRCSPSSFWVSSCSGGALLVEFRLHPPVWVHVVLWGLLTPLLAFGLLRLLKATLIALQYKHKAGEGRPRGRLSDHAATLRQARPDLADDARHRWPGRAGRVSAPGSSDASAGRRTCWPRLRHGSHADPVALRGRAAACGAGQDIEYLHVSRPAASTTTRRRTSMRRRREASPGTSTRRSSWLAGASSGSIAGRARRHARMPATRREGQVAGEKERPGLGRDAAGQRAVRAGEQCRGQRLVLAGAGGHDRFGLRPQPAECRCRCRSMRTPAPSRREACPRAGVTRHRPAQPASGVRPDLVRPRTRAPGGLF